MTGELSYGKESQMLVFDLAKRGGMRRAREYKECVARFGCVELSTLRVSVTECFHAKGPEDILVTGVRLC